MSSLRSQLSIPKEEITHSSDLVLVEEQKSGIQDNTPYPYKNFTFVDGLRVVGKFSDEQIKTKPSRTLEGFYIVQGEAETYYDAKDFSPEENERCFTPIPISTSSFGLVFGDKIKSEANYIVVIDVRSVQIIQQLKLPHSASIDLSVDFYDYHIFVKTFRRNTHCYAVAVNKNCWIYNSKTDKWNAIFDDESPSRVQGLIILPNNDLGRVSRTYESQSLPEATAFVSLRVYHVNFDTAEASFAYRMNTYKTYKQTDPDSQIHSAISPISRFHFIFNKRLFTIKDEIVPIDIPFDADRDLRLLDWLPDGSLIGITHNHHLIQIRIINDEANVTDLKLQADNLHVFPDGKILVSHNGNNFIYESQNVQSALENRDTKPFNIIEEQFLQFLSQLLPMFSLPLLKLFVEYSAEDECRQLCEAPHLSIPVCCDMDSKLRELIERCYWNLEHSRGYGFFDLEPSKNGAAVWHRMQSFIYSPGKKGKLKKALEYFVSLLKQEKSFTKCLKVALSSEFQNEIVTLGKHITALGLEIEKVMPKNAKPVGLRRMFSSL